MRICERERENKENTEIERMKERKRE